MTPSIRIRPSFHHSQSLPSESFHKSPILIHQRNENHNHRKIIKLITWTTVLCNSMKLWAMPCRPLKMDRSWWRVLTKRGPLEKEMATHSSILAWRIPGTEEPGGLLSMGSHRVGHDWSDLVAAVVKNMHANARDIRDVGWIPRSGRSPGGRHGNPLQYSCLENPMDGGAWETAVHGVAKSRTWLKQLSTHTCYNSYLTST